MRQTLTLDNGLSKTDIQFVVVMEMRKCFAVITK